MWSSAKYLPENKDLDGLDLTAISCQTCVIVNIGNGSLKNQDALFEKLQMKVSFQEDVLVWNLCICCIIQTENLFQLKKNLHAFGGKHWKTFTKLDFAMHTDSLQHFFSPWAVNKETDSIQRAADAFYFV